MAAQIANGGSGNAAFKVRSGTAKLENSQLTQAAGQGEAQSCPERQHYCGKRYAALPVLW
jgi:hypothetical protein